MLSRRGFLGMLLAAPLAGMVCLRVPRRVPYRGVTLQQIMEVTMPEIIPATHRAYFREAPLTAYLRDRG